MIEGISLNSPLLSIPHLPLSHSTKALGMKGFQHSVQRRLVNVSLGRFRVLGCGLKAWEFPQIGNPNLVT